MKIVIIGGGIAGLSLAMNLHRHGIAARVFESFNKRFWYEEGGYLYDVVEAEGDGDDGRCRPNQVIAISLDNPVLDPSRWGRVMRVVTEKLLTPVGLRSLAPGSPDFKAKYYGDLRARDAAYHQGTVWAWLIGPWIDAWLRAFPEDWETARSLLAGFDSEMSEAGIGTFTGRRAAGSGGSPTRLPT